MRMEMSRILNLELLQDCRKCSFFGHCSIYDHENIFPCPCHNCIVKSICSDCCEKRAVLWRMSNERLRVTRLY